MTNDEKRESVLRWAESQLGVLESPPGSNRVKYNDWYYKRAVSGTAYPWCMTFVQWVFDRAKLPLPVKTASCTALASYAKAHGQWVTGGYQPGDVVLFDFSGNRGKTEHVGIVERVKSGSLVTIEGNTGAGNDANGGEVQRRTRAIGLVTGAWRPEWKEDSMTQDEFNKMADAYLETRAARQPGEWSKEARAWAEANGVLAGDASGRKQYQSFCTREQMVVFLKRLAELEG